MPLNNESVYAKVGYDSTPKISSRMASACPNDPTNLAAAPGQTFYNYYLSSVLKSLLFSL